MHTQPLAGRQIVITRAREQASGLSERLRALGAEPLLCPAIAFAPPTNLAALDSAIRQIGSYDWLLLTSANGVQALFTRMEALGQPVSQLQRLKVGAIGPATAAALVAHGVQANFVPGTYVAEAILAEIGVVAGQRFLLPRADIAREALAVGLRAMGAFVDEIAAYRTVPGIGAAELATRLRGAPVDAITFTSSSTVRYLLDGLEQQGMPRSEARARLAASAIVCIGPITAATARAEQLPVAAEAREYTAEGVVAALLELFLIRE